ncbi:MAG: dodecin domain-containing protein [Armatimonadetes bacterium]|nr:dodecin domain-containing protein [Armatimonadota bacterium]
MAVLKVIELVGASSESWERAVRSAVEEASKTIEHIEGVEVTNLSATLSDGNIREWQADIRISFRVEEQLRHEHHEHHPSGERAHV